MVVTILGKQERGLEVIANEQGKPELEKSVNYELVQAGLALLERKRDPKFEALVRHSIFSQTSYLSWSTSI